MWTSQKQLFSTIVLLLVTIVTAAAPADFNSEYVNSLKGKNGIIRLTDATFSNVINGPRDYTVAVLLTAEKPQYGCGFCKVVGPPFEKIATSWNQDHPKGDGLFFAVADIADTQAAFAQLGLKQAPNLWIYPATEIASKANDVNYGGYDVYQFPPTENQVKSLVGYLSSKYGKHVVIHEPFPWDRLFISIGTFVLSAIALKISYPIILAVLQKKQVWIAVSLVTILMFTGGHMFNLIRKTPYIAGDGKGGVAYFVGGHSNQVAVETQIVAIIYAILAFSTISLVVKVPRISNPQIQMLTVSTLSLIIFVVFSFLMVKFQVKNGGYPFKLLDIFPK